MPRKAAATADGDSKEVLRRSSRIKVQPTKEDPPKKVPKLRTKKADKDSADKEEKPKSSRGKKRKAEEEPNGDVEDAVAPTEKKVRFFFLSRI
jgi:hypothetical protein